MNNNNIKRQETVENSESKQVEYSGVFKTSNELKIQAISSNFLLYIGTLMTIFLLMC